MTQLPANVLAAQINNGLTLMLLGMGVVFFFLILLVFSTKGISAFARKITPAKPVTQKNVNITNNIDNDSEIAVAIAAAVAQSQN